MNQSSASHRQISRPAISNDRALGRESDPNDIFSPEENIVLRSTSTAATYQPIWICKKVLPKSFAGKTCPKQLLYRIKQPFVWKEHHPVLSNGFQSKPSSWRQIRAPSNFPRQDHSPARFTEELSGRASASRGRLAHTDRACCIVEHLASLGMIYPPSHHTIRVHSRYVGLHDRV